MEAEGLLQTAQILFLLFYERAAGEKEGMVCSGRAGEPSQGGSGGWKKPRCKGWRNGKELAE